MKTRPFSTSVSANNFVDYIFRSKVMISERSRSEVVDFVYPLEWDLNVKKNAK